MATATVPCAYKVGKTLGQGTYAVVKEAVHIKTGQYYACKVISKRLMEGREHMVRNEIAALKKVSQVRRLSTERGEEGPWFTVVQRFACSLTSKLCAN